MTDDGEPKFTFSNYRLTEPMTQEELEREFRALDAHFAEWPSHREALLHHLAEGERRFWERWGRR